MLTGIQDKFSFKQVALAAIAGGVGGGIKGLGEVAKATVRDGGALSTFGKIGQYLNSGTFMADVVRGAVSNAVSQGVSVATGLQKQFSWTSVAIGGVVGGAVGVAGRGLAGYGIGMSPRADMYANQALSGMAGALAGAGAKSLIDGTSFGDNVMSALPDVIGATIGNMLGDSARGIGRGQQKDAGGSDAGGGGFNDRNPLPRKFGGSGSRLSQMMGGALNATSPTGRFDKYGNSIENYDGVSDLRKMLSDNRRAGYKTKQEQRDVEAAINTAINAASPSSATIAPASDEIVVIAPRTGAQERARVGNYSASANDQMSRNIAASLGGAGSYNRDSLFGPGLYYEPPASVTNQYSDGVQSFVSRAAMMAAGRTTILTNPTPDYILEMRAQTQSFFNNPGFSTGLAVSLGGSARQIEAAGQFGQLVETALTARAIGGVRGGASVRPPSASFVYRSGSVNYAAERGLIGPPSFTTKSGEAYFWSGLGRGGAETAAGVARRGGGTTLEMFIESRGINMPAWDAANPGSIKAWQDVSRAYASSASGEVRAVVGSNLRPGNIWQSVELPALQRNPNVTRVIQVNPTTGVEAVLWGR